MAYHQTQMQTDPRRQFSQKLLLGLVATFFVVPIFSGPAPVTAAGVPETFDPASIIDPTSFINVDSLSVNDIQAFLVAKGSGLAGFSQNGRTAAQIIWGAAHGQGDATGTINGIAINQTTGTVNPKVILVTLQKEQSLMTTASPSQAALDTAMGFSCPDSGGCNPNYKGFTKQVENAAWQLRYNFERATNSQFSDYKVGQTMTFANTLNPYNPPASQTITLANAAAASLYRYTPHVYNGNYNFWKFYRQWFARYQAQFVSETNTKTLANTETAVFSATIRNTGDETWRQGIVNLGTSSDFDRIPAFIREDKLGGNVSGWLSGNRVQMAEKTVAPGATGTFQFYYTVPADLAAGVYHEAFTPVVDGVGWFDDVGISWDITVVALKDSFKPVIIHRSDNPVVTAGQVAMLELSVQNAGYFTWKQGTVNLATDRLRDRIPRFIREDRVGGNPSGWLKENRVQLVEATVPPGGIGTFRFYYTVPDDLAAGSYREYFRPVADGLMWLEDPNFDLSWDVIVKTRQEALLSTNWVTQNANPTLKAGQSYQFVLQMKNTGLSSWKQGTVNLATDRLRDRIPRFIREDRVGGNPSGWLKENRVQLVEATVPPGGIGTFRFYYTVPDDLAAGSYREYFRAVNESVGWMDDWGIYWDVTITK